jgi:hypothetical protein
LFLLFLFSDTSAKQRTKLSGNHRILSVVRFMALLAKPPDIEPLVLIVTVVVRFWNTGLHAG